MPDKTFGKSEKLKRRSQIRALFTKGKSIKQFPVKLVYLPLSQAENHKLAVSVPKRNFKRAVDRNRLKRLLRESYRLNKTFIPEQSPPYAMMLIYIGKKKTGFKEISFSVKKLLSSL